MKLVLAFGLICCCSQGFAQTDVIEFKSHSGNMLKFTKSSARSIDGITTNFGEAPQLNIVNAVLDTVKFISKTQAIMVTSEYCRREDYGYTTPKRPLKRTEFGHLWQSGSDTLECHPLFSMQHQLDSIKKVLKSTYNFQNDIDEVVFIDYDNGKARRQDADEKSGGRKMKKETKEKETKGGIGFTLLLSILLPGLLIYVCGPLFFNWAKES